MFDKAKSFLSKYRNSISAISALLIMLSWPKKFSELPDHLSYPPFPWIKHMLEEHGILGIGVILSIYIIAMDFRPWFKRWRLKRKSKLNEISSNILNSSNEFSISIALSLILCPNPSQVAKNTLHENISDYLTEKYNASVDRRIKKLKDGEEGDLLKFLGEGLLRNRKRNKSSTYSLNKRISKSDLIEFCETKGFDIPDSLEA